MSLFGRILGAAVQGAGARRAGLNAGEAVRVQQEREEAERARQQQMDLLRMALEQSQTRRNDAAAVKAATPVTPAAPTVSVMGRRLPDTPEGRAEAVRWREENRAPRQPRSGGSGATRTRSTGGTATAQPRSVVLRSANGEAGTLAPNMNSLGNLRHNLRQKYRGQLTEGEIQGIAQRAWERHRRSSAATTAPKRRENGHLP